MIAINSAIEARPQRCLGEMETFMTIQGLTFRANHGCPTNRYILGPWVKTLFILALRSLLDRRIFSLIVEIKPTFEEGTGIRIWRAVINFRVTAYHSVSRGNAEQVIMQVYNEATRFEFPCYNVAHLARIDTPNTTVAVFLSYLSALSIQNMRRLDLTLSAWDCYSHY
ncbi:hypothetical protein P691DRAFT_785491 [Macrolepiota fuliginosa MF-IS2]|uniref:Uncharacterized protein n=1 Tax=Macrolepiota fuliginosa MF-IS2 TaxID=1400762 RepID=A0A9P5X678_9AGAR|nr:hypothetical protein P691DRAFT_785491 [Macrolepiota fuliginosa MF-IS2]